METTKRTGRASRPKRLRQRRARPGAARGRAPHSRTPSGGSRGTPPSPAAQARSRDRRGAARTSRASTRRRAEARSPGPAKRSWSSAVYVTSSPSPSSPPPRSWTTVVTRVNSLETACSQPLELVARRSSAAGRKRVAIASTQCRRSMAIRALVAAALLILAGCGGATEATREVHLLAPAGYVEDGSTDSAWTPSRRSSAGPAAASTSASTTRTKIIAAIARDATQMRRRHRRRRCRSARTRGPTSAERNSRGSRSTKRHRDHVPKRLASAFDGVARPADSRTIAWVIRKDGDNPDCAERWIDYATSQ